MIYLDHAASTPLRESARVAWLEASASTANAGDRKPVKIMISAKNMADPFYSWLCNSTVEALKKARPDAEYKVFDLMGDPANTQQLIDQSILEGFNALIFDKELP